MPSKRYHSKSRLGCKQCKARRIRCDQTAPCCFNCAKKGIECDFKDLSGALSNLRLFTPASFGHTAQATPRQQQQPVQQVQFQAVIDAGHSSSHSSSRRNSRKQSASSASSSNAPTRTASSSAGPSPEASSSLSSAPSAGCSPAPFGSPFPAPSSAFSLEDMGLLQYFILYSSQTLTPLDTDDYWPIWQHEVPRLAQSYPFLMHAILSFAAAHQATCEPQDIADPLCIARHHYSTALSCFRDSVREVTPDQADPLLCFCILTSLLSLRLGFDRPLDQGDSIDEFINLMHTLHRSMGVLNQVKGSLQSSRIGTLLRHTRDQEQHYISPEFLYSLNQMESHALLYVDPVSEPTRSAALTDAMIRLRHFYTLSSPRPKSWAHLLSFPISLGPSFASLVEQRDGLALCILAHWAVPAYNAPAKWFSGDWPRRLMMAISSELSSPEWTETMRWPLSETLERDTHDLFAMEDLNSTVFSL